MSDDLRESTAGKLHHYFGNEVGLARQFYTEGILICDFEARQSAFITGLERAIASGAAESRGVTSGHLKEMIDLAGGDWSDVETIKALYCRYSEITGLQCDVEELFAPDI